MIKDQTIDEALIEIMRTKKALELLRQSRKSKNLGHERFIDTGHWTEVAEHAAAKRASMDLTRVLAKLRAGK